MNVERAAQRLRDVAETLHWLGARLREHGRSGDAETAFEAATTLACACVDLGVECECGPDGDCG